jgi:hypothetical protein
LAKPRGARRRLLGDDRWAQRDVAHAAVIVVGVMNGAMSRIHTVIVGSNGGAMRINKHQAPRRDAVRAPTIMHSHAVAIAGDHRRDMPARPMATAPISKVGSAHPSNLEDHAGDGGGRYL